MKCNRFLRSCGAQSQELKGIPGAGVLKSADSLKLDVTVRSGTVIEIHPDHVKKWSQTAFADEFSKLAENHSSNFKELLKPVLAASSSSHSVPTDEPAEAEDSSNVAAADSSSLSLKTWESYDSLHGEDEISHRCVSEIVGVDLLKSKAGHFYLISEKGKVLPKHSIIGGFGTGKRLVLGCSCS